MVNILAQVDTYTLSHEWMRENHTKDIVYIYNRNEPFILYGLAGKIYTLMNTRIEFDHIKWLERVAKANGIKNPPIKMLVDLNMHYNGDLSQVLDIKMLPEFTWIPQGTPFCKITNKVEGFAGLCSWWEGYLSHAHFPSTVVTRMYQYKKAGLANIHNFGYRASRSPQDSWKSDSAFLFFYPGTDCFNINLLIDWAKYDRAVPDEVLSFMPYRDILKELKPTSIAAGSHLVIQSFKKERLGYFNIIKKHANDTVAFPIDTYTPEVFFSKHLQECLHWACEFNTNLYFRIDSGDLVWQAMQIIEAIIKFKTTEAVINKQTIPRFGVIIGDSMDFERVQYVYTMITAMLTNYPDANINDYLYFGVGSSIINGITRDTIGWVTKLGWSSDSGATMKITVGKESLLGDMELSFDTGSWAYIVEEKSEHAEGTSMYVDWTAAVDKNNWEAMREGRLKECTLQVSPQLQASIQKFKDKHLN